MPVHRRMRDELRLTKIRKRKIPQVNEEVARVVKDLSFPEQRIRIRQRKQLKHWLKTHLTNLNDEELFALVGALQKDLFLADGVAAIIDAQLDTANLFDPITFRAESVTRLLMAYFQRLEIGWLDIDVYRAEKFLKVIRRILENIFKQLARMDWNQEAVVSLASAFVYILPIKLTSDEVIPYPLRELYRQKRSPAPPGPAIQVIACLFDTLAGVVTTPIEFDDKFTLDKFLTIIGPFLHLLSINTTSEATKTRVIQEILQPMAAHPTCDPIFPDSMRVDGLKLAGTLAFIFAAQRRCLGSTVEKLKEFIGFCDEELSKMDAEIDYYSLVNPTTSRPHFDLETIRSLGGLTVASLVPPPIPREEVVAEGPTGQTPSAAEEEIGEVTVDPAKEATAEVTTPPMKRSKGTRAVGPTKKKAGRAKKATAEATAAPAKGATAVAGRKAVAKAVARKSVKPKAAGSPKQGSV